MDVVQIITKFGEYIAMLFNYIKEFLTSIGIIKTDAAAADDESTTAA